MIGGGVVRTHKMVRERGNVKREADSRVPETAHKAMMNGTGCRLQIVQCCTPNLVRIQMRGRARTR